jgi:DNA oxidative demethylase
MAPGSIPEFCDARFAGYHGFVRYIRTGFWGCKRWKRVFSSYLRFSLRESELGRRMRAKPIDLNGAEVWKEYLSSIAQQDMVKDLREVAKAAPFRRYRTPGGRPMSVRMTAAGDVGWISDSSGYRYSAIQPDGARWPDIPESILSVWRDVSGTQRMPDSCLVNFYDNSARMGLHQDRDEADLSWPVVSISLGADALFRVGQVERGGPTRSLWLGSGDVVVLAGAARLAYHGIDRLRPGSSELLREGGRINVTLRVAQ